MCTHSGLRANGRLHPYEMHAVAFVWLSVLNRGDRMIHMEQESYDLDEQYTIPRHRLFVLLDGTFAVRWSENRIQELESGHYRTYEKRDFGAPITDYELNQLKGAGLVEDFTKEAVILRPLPERPPQDELTLWEQNRVRSYYLNTTLPGSHLQDVADLLEDLHLSDQFQARVRDDFVVLWAHKGLSFPKFDDAERARHHLATAAPEAFENTVVAFIETTRRD